LFHKACTILLLGFVTVWITRATAAFKPQSLSVATRSSKVTSPKTNQIKQNNDNIHAILYSKKGPNRN
jgi:hypothetical protein